MATVSPSSTQLEADSGPSEGEVTFEQLTLEVDHLRAELAEARLKPHRTRLPDTRQSITHKFSISGHEGYITVGLFPDGRPGELFIVMAKQGSTIAGLMDSIAILTSLNLQYGVPVETLARKFHGTRFEPSGHTKSSEIRIAYSICDYVFTWLGLRFSKEFREEYASRAAYVDQQGLNPL